MEHARPDFEPDGDAMKTVAPLGKINEVKGNSRMHLKTHLDLWCLTLRLKPLEPTVAWSPLCLCYALQSRNYLFLFTLLSFLNY